MKSTVTFIFILFCSSTFGYGASSPSHLPSVKILIERIKHSTSTERKKALSLLKQKLKGIKKTQRRIIMLKLQKSLKSSPKNIPNRASEILGSFSVKGGDGFDRSKHGGGDSSGNGDSGGSNEGGHNGGGNGGGGNGGGSGGH